MSDALQLFLPVAAVLCFGIFVQSAAGFAAGMLCVPALLWLDYTIPAAQMALLVATVPQNIYGVWSLRQEIQPRQVAFPALARIAFFPIGILALARMESLPAEQVRQVVSGFILIATITTFLYRPQPHETLHPGWSWLTFPLSGFFQGLVGMGGPVLVIWVQAHNWSAKRSRAFLFAMYLVSLPPALFVLAYQFGDRIVAPGMIALASLPLLWMTTHFGLRVGNWLGRDRLRTVTLLLLLAISVSGLVAPWLR